MESKKYHTLIPLFTELKGEQVTIRLYREEDAQALFEAVAESRDHIRPWLPFADAHQTIEESRDWIIQQHAQFLLRESMNFSLWDTASGRFVGGSGLHPRNWDIGYFEIGYWLRTSATGHGYITETVKLCTDYLFTRLHANRVEIRCDVKNERSAAIPRRLGFVQEGLKRNDMQNTAGELRSTLIFAMTPEDRRD